MNDQLKRLLDHLAATLDPRRQIEIELLHRKALGWEPLQRLISPAMYRKHVASHDEMVLGGLGGGGIHTCGKFEHNVGEFLALPSIRCIDVGQPELNDIDAIYAKAKQRKIPLVRVNVAREELVSGRVMERFPTGVSLVHQAESLADAQAVMAAYRQTTE